MHLKVRVYGSRMTNDLIHSFPTLVKNSFQTIEEYSSALSPLNLSGSQLSKGDFNGRSKTIKSNSFVLSIREADAKHFQNAQINHSIIGMIFPLVPNEYISNGKCLGPEKQYIIFRGEDNKVIFPQNHKHISLLFNTNDLYNYFSEDEVQLFIKTYQDISTGMVSSDQKLLLTQKLYNLFETFKQLDRNHINIELVYKDAYDSLFHSLFNYQQAHSSRKIDRVKNNERLLTRALEYIDSESLQTLTVSSLVNNIHASSRSIQYCFSELLGMTPKKYLVRLRLNAIRRELNESSPNEKTITNIANKYGVINIGRFKQDYEQFFNETPRETLNNSY